MMRSSASVRVGDCRGGTVFLSFRLDARRWQKVTNYLVVIRSRFERLDSEGGCPYVSISRPRSSGRHVLRPNINLKGMFRVTQHALPLPKEGGTIFNISPVAARVGNKSGRSLCGATKAAVDALTKSWALEPAPKKIRVNSVAPGYVEIDMTAKFFSESAFDCHGDGIASTEAQRGDSAGNVAPDHFIDKRHQHARSACADGMADCHCPTIDIYFVDVEPEFADHTQRLHGEGLVQFVKIHVFIFPAGLLPDLANGTDRGHHHPRRIDTAGCLRHNADHRLGAKLFSSCGARHNNRSSPVIHSWRIAGRDCSVFLEGWFQRAEDFNSGALPRRLVFIENYRRVALLLSGQLNRHDLRL